MRKSEAAVYVCPRTLEPLVLRVTEERGGEVFSGSLAGYYALPSQSYRIVRGIPELVWPKSAPESDQQAKEWYDRNADVYDEYLPLTFATFDVDEQMVRKRMVRSLRLRPDHVVLETGAGTGRDSVLIAEKLAPWGKLYVQDLSRKILEVCVAKLADSAVAVEFHVGNACYLPFHDRFFDATFHFGGLNTFSDVRRALAEMARVTKVGGRVVVGDESMPPWLRETEFAKILMNTNSLYRYPLPLECLPVCARDVRLRWIIGGVFFVIDFTVGDGEPKADVDFEIPGVRGGTHRTRYYGQLEGVTLEAKRLVQQASERTGKSAHRWLDDVVREAAEKDLRCD